MNDKMKEQVAFMAASLIELADMTDSALQDVVEVVGVDAIQELMGMERLRFETSYEEMVEEICICIDWEPMLISPWRTDEDLSRLGLLIADLVADDSPADEDAAESLFSVLSWCGIEAWLAANDE